MRTDYSSLQTKPSTERLTKSVPTIQDLEFGTLLLHLIIRVKFGTCAQNLDFPIRYQAVPNTVHRDEIGSFLWTSL